MKAVLHFAVAVVLTAFVIELRADADRSEVMLRLAEAKSLVVVRTDTYWDGGSIGITLATDKGKAVYVLALNPKLSPAERAFTISLQPPAAGDAVIEKKSSVEQRLIKLLEEHSAANKKLRGIANALRAIIADRNLPFPSADFHTMEFLTESLKRD